MAIGKCQLTGEYGPLVKAHILPRALTSADEAGACFAQAGHNSPPIKRWTSWYDANLVTRAGEDILAEYDDWAIEALRQHRLVWSGWGDERQLIASDHSVMPHDSNYGLREIENLDGMRLRLFCLSLLWRAAASRLSEFEEIDIHASDMRRLRNMLVNRDPQPYDLFPVTLLQLSTRGDVHNFTPIAQNIPLNLSPASDRGTPIFRFYIDGLIIHFRRDARKTDVASMGNVYLGDFSKIALATVTYERSWQRENLFLTLAEVESRWLDRLERIPGFGPRQHISDRTSRKIGFGE
jgi:hypothetical protein